MNFIFLEVSYFFLILRLWILFLNLFDFFLKECYFKVIGERKFMNYRKLERFKDRVF